MQVRSNKRQKERERQEYQKEKAAKRLERKRLKAEQPGREAEGIDPDIAHIIPGPQPLME